ncbi:MAG: SpoIIIAC/SpoIIIAD family protein [Acutalibacter sp.]
MELFAIGVCALCAVLFAALVQKTNKEYALLISLGTAAVLLLFLLERAGPVLQQVEDLAASGPLEGEAVGLMLRAVGITVVGQVVARLCKDAGESALAYTVELAARAAVLAAALPALGRLLKYLGEIAAL